MLLHAAAYALILSPNQTPSRDQYFIEKLVGLQRDDYQISTLFYCLFNAMGVYPLIFLSLLQPSAKSSNKVNPLMMPDTAVACQSGGCGKVLFTNTGTFVAIHDSLFRSWLPSAWALFCFVEAFRRCADSPSPATPGAQSVAALMQICAPCSCRL